MGRCGGSRAPTRIRVGRRSWTPAAGPLPTTRSLNVCALTSGQHGLPPGRSRTAWLHAVAAGPEHLAVMRELAFRSMVTVPLRHGDADAGGAHAVLRGLRPAPHRRRRGPHRRAGAPRRDGRRERPPLQRGAGGDPRPRRVPVDRVPRAAQPGGGDEGRGTDASAGRAARAAGSVSDWTGTSASSS